MDEIKMVELAFTEPPASADATDAGRIRLLSLVSIEANTGAGTETNGPRTSGGRPAGKRPRALRWSFGIGLAAVATATAAVVAAASLSPGSRTQALSARQVLLTAATKTIAASPGDGRYLRIRTESGNVRRVGPEGHQYTMMTRRVDDRWYPNAPGVAGWYVSQYLGASPATPADMAAWRADGSPSQWRQECYTSIGPKKRVVLPTPTPGDGTIESVSPSLPPRSVMCPPITAKPGPVRTEWMGGNLAAFLTPPSRGLDSAKLSADPATLKKQLLTWTHGGGLAGPVNGDDAQLWAAVQTLLFSPSGPVPSKVRAAGYRLLADLPGVRSLGTTSDPSGRRGQGLEFADVTGRSRLIIDLRTGLPMVAESLDASSKRSEYEMTLLYKITDAEPPHQGSCSPTCH